jgi:hypothetical protein
MFLHFIQTTCKLNLSHCRFSILPSIDSHDNSHTRWSSVMLGADGNGGACLQKEMKLEIEMENRRLCGSPGGSTAKLLTVSTQDGV